MVSATVTNIAVVDDKHNLDNDSATDKILQLLWASVTNQFPNTPLPGTIAKVTFSTTAAAFDPVTGLDTSIHYTSTGAAMNYEFFGSSTKLED